MLRYWKTAMGIAVLALLTFAPAASAQRRGVVFRGGFYGPGWGWYNPYWGWGWGWGGPYAYGYVPNAPPTGTVKIVTPAKDADVYVDGGFAGQAGQLKKFKLPVGTHNIELRDHSGHTFHQQSVNVIGGRTVEIDAGVAS